LEADDANGGRDTSDLQAHLSMPTTWVSTGSAFVVPSAMAKAAVHAMTRSLAVEWARYGIRVNGLAPGPVPTENTLAVLNPTDKSSVGPLQADQIPMGRTGTVEELANLTMFLLSDACPYLTRRRSRWTAVRCSPGPARSPA
jgi:NAD(P)-dependent dehydrogenase (short-subunit alcohol dehydrogenase family)